MAQVLDAFGTPPSRNLMTILLVGIQGVNKDSLAKCLVEVDTPCSVQIRTTSGSPFLDSSLTDRPNIDFICFLFDLRCKNSLKFIYSALQQVDLEYFMGKSCLVATQGPNPLFNIIEDDTIEELASKYGLQTLYLKSEDGRELSHHASRIIQMSLIASGYKKHVTPTVIETTKDFGVSSLL